MTRWQRFPLREGEKCEGGTKQECVRERTPNYHINGLQAAAAGRRVGKMQKSEAAASSVAAALTACRRSWQWDQAAGSGNQATKQAGRQAATKRFSNLPNGYHFLIIVAASCNIIIIAIKPHFSSHTSPPPRTRLRLCCSCAD